MFFSAVDVYLGFGFILLLEMEYTSFLTFSIHKFGILIKLN